MNTEENTDETKIDKLSSTVDNKKTLETKNINDTQESISTTKTLQKNNTLRYTLVILGLIVLICGFFVSVKIKKRFQSKEQGF